MPLPHISVSLALDPQILDRNMDLKIRRSNLDTIVVKNEFWKIENQLSFDSCKIGAKSTRIDMASDSGENTAHVLHQGI